MKKNQTVESRKSKVESKQSHAPLFSSPRPSTLGPRLAFTLIELLVVISIIGVLAAFTLSVMKSVKRTQYISHTRAEMGLLETAIQRYQSHYGFYPPSNPNYPADTNDAMFSPLYFELLGTTNDNPANPAVGTYYTLDRSASIAAGSVTAGFGVGGFINCSKTGSAEDAPAAQNFLPGLKANQVGTNLNNGVLITVLAASVGGPDQSYVPVPGAQGLNPWRYACPGTNNPSSYDLWIQLQIGGKKYLVCNWSGQAQVNSPLP